MRSQLRELGVRVVKIGTVFERMSYDKDVIPVQAGKPVEFVLENNDLMPHNFVILEPGSLEEIGLFSETHAQQPGFAAQNYVPAVIEDPPVERPASAAGFTGVELRRTLSAGRLSLCLHLSWTLAADVWGFVRGR